MKNYIFHVDSGQPTVKYDDDPDHKTISYNHYKDSSNNRSLNLGLHPLPPLQRPGLKGIKQVELWKKWSQNVLEDFRSEIYPRYVALCCF
jgi:hypothetical protein